MNGVFLIKSILTGLNREMKVFELHLPLMAGGFYLLQPAVYSNNFYF